MGGFNLELQDPIIHCYIKEDINLIPIVIIFLA